MVYPHVSVVTMEAGVEKNLLVDVSYLNVQLLMHGSELDC